MKKLVLLFVVLGACRSSGGGSMPAPSAGATVGAPSPRAAVEQFLSAVKAADLQMMSEKWGTTKGPARDQLERTELDQRTLIMQGCFDHDKFRLLEELPGEGGTRVFRVELTKGTVVATPRFTTIRGPSDRWYVQDGELSAARAICRTK